MRKRKGKAEWLPWYRARNYDGDPTEAEKRQLDAFRMQPRHPAARWDDLPEEVRDYISGIELELYDHKQQEAAGRAFFSSGIGAVLLFLTYKGWLDVPTIWTYLASVLLLVFPWFFYSHQWKKNAEEFLPSGAPYNATEERIRKEWELNYIVDIRRGQREQEARRDTNRSF
jgi:hypothetical protein